MTRSSPRGSRAAVLAVALAFGCEGAPSEARPKGERAESKRVVSPERRDGSGSEPTRRTASDAKRSAAGGPNPEPSPDGTNAGSPGPTPGEPVPDLAPEDDAVIELDLRLLPPPPSGGPYAAPTEPELRMAGREDDRDKCERWPAMREPSAELSRTCARFWVVRHGYDGHYGDFSLDPQPGGSAFTRLSAQTLLAMAIRVKAYCGSECAPIDQRAIELFETSAGYHYRFDEVDPDAPWLVPMFQALLRGEPSRPRCASTSPRRGRPSRICWGGCLR